MAEINYSEFEAAALIGVSVHFMRARRRINNGPSYRKIGARVIYPDSQIKKWLALHPLRGSGQKVA